MLRVINRTADNGNWAVRTREDGKSLAKFATKPAAIALARRHLSSSRTGGTLRIYRSDGQLQTELRVASNHGPSLKRNGSSSSSTEELHQSSAADFSVFHELFDALVAAGDSDKVSLAQVLQNSVRSDNSRLSIRRPPGLLTFDIDDFSSNAAKAWASLGQATRSAILNATVSVTGSDPAEGLSKIYGAIESVLGLAAATARLQATTSAILRKQNEILAKLTAVAEGIENIKEKIDEHVLVAARAGVAHLLAAANTDKQTILDQQLSAASQQFTLLTQLDPNRETKGTSTEKSNRELIVLGHWGNHLYSDIYGSRRSALREAYACAKKYPLESVALFPRGYFDQDYRSLLEDRLNDVSKSEAEFLKAKDGAYDRIHWLPRSALGLAAGAASFAGASILLPFIPGAGAMAAVSSMKAIDAFNRADLAPYAAAVVKYQNELAGLLGRISEECSMKEDILNVLTEDDLRSLVRDAP